MSQAHWFRCHTWPINTSQLITSVRFSESHHSKNATSQTESEFSLSIQLDQKSRNQQEHEEQSQTLAFPEPQIESS